MHDCICICIYVAVVWTSASLIMLTVRSCMACPLLLLILLAASAWCSLEILSTLYTVFIHIKAGLLYKQGKYTYHQSQLIHKSTDPYSKNETCSISLDLAWHLTQYTKSWVPPSTQEDSGTFGERALHITHYQKSTTCTCI